MSSTPTHGAPTNAPNEAPEMLEGWRVLHTTWRRDRSLPAPVAAPFLGDAATTGVYRILGHKADLLVIAYARTAAELLDLHARQQAVAARAGLVAVSSFVSVVEASLYEATGVAHAVLARRGLAPRSPEWTAAFEAEMATQRDLLQERVWRPLPDQEWVCYYPMSKRRGETFNWYALPLDDRRKAMRGHGQIGARFAGQVVQVISGATGLDDWEWAVDLHAADPLVFKHLVTAMRFDEASSRYAEFGEFLIAARLTPARWADLRA